MRQFFRRNWPMIVAMYAGGSMHAFTGFGAFHWEWWVALSPVFFTIGALQSYRERYLKALDKW